MENINMHKCITSNISNIQNLINNDKETYFFFNNSPLAWRIPDIDLDNIFNSLRNNELIIRIILQENDKLKEGFVIIGEVYTTPNKLLTLYI